MYAETNERPGVDESYQTATNTSDLSVEGDRRGSGDVLIAAGWSESRIGMALLRLHSEWDASEKPAKPTKTGIQEMAGTFQRALPGETPAEGKTKPLTISQAHHYASTWYSHEVAMLLGKLKALPAVRQQVTVQALRWGMHEAQAKASATVRYWLDQACGGCHGLKWQPIHGAPALSNRPCRVCGGTGFAQAPHGQEGKRLANFMDDCVSRARQSMRNRLHVAQQ
jgi:hypothetical protein